MRFLLLLLLIILTKTLSAQETYGITGFASRYDTKNQEELIQSRPKEILFGIHFQGDTAYFNITNLEWFKKIFSTPGDAVTTDIISRDMVGCNKNLATNKWYRGLVLPPVQGAELKRRMRLLPDGSVLVPIGRLPTSLLGKELEGNLVLIRDREITFYTNFYNLDRSLWELLDMGLYTDSLLRQIKDEKDTRFIYSKKVTLTIPFAKGKATVTPADIKPLFDSMHLSGFQVQKVLIRAFSSVEGSEATNIALQKGRARSIVAAIQSLQRGSVRTEITAGENWVDFVGSLEGTPFEFLAKATKTEIKLRLSDKQLADAIEPILSRQRKAVVTLYLAPRSSDLPNTELATAFQKAVQDKKLAEAAALQREVFDRIADNRLPENYLESLPVPFEKPYSRLLSDQQVYRLLLGSIEEDDALAEFMRIDALSPGSGRVSYNICALQLRLLQFNEKAANTDSLRTRINGLTNLGIPALLVGRMQINYRILRCEALMRDGKFDEKDAVLNEIRQRYSTIGLSDEDLLSLGKYFSQYAQYMWAEQLVTARMTALDVSTDLLFFYLNLAFFTRDEPAFEEDPQIHRMLLNAMSIDRARFCRFFNSTVQGGVSMQLVLKPFWKTLYCENCNNLKPGFL